jgi:tryptophan-rich sensory protein
MQDFPTWYAQLQKPSWTPDASIIGAIWTILYPVIIVMNLIANFSFTPVQFGLRNLPLASLVILVVLSTAILSAVQLFPTQRALAYALLPYVVWVSIASVLQISITWLNR